MATTESIEFEVDDTPLPPLYYAGRQGYAMLSGSRYIQLTNDTQAKEHLKAMGCDPVPEVLCRIREENYVAYIGPVAGYRPGVYVAKDSGEKILVTAGPKIIPGAAGAFPFIKAFLEDQFLDERHPDQLRALFAWLHHARKNVINGTRRPLPALVVVGPRNCGKSLFIELVRLFLGGRTASAFAALAGTTIFNGDILGAELLVIDDEIASRDHRARTALGQGIKKHFFAGSVRIESKFRQAVTMRPVQALVIAVNSEPEHLQVLPVLDDSLRDKISLVRCSMADLGAYEREDIAGFIEAELPAFIDHVENTIIPAHLQDPRTGAAAWWHPAVVEMLAVIAPEERLRELMVQCPEIAGKIKFHSFWEGTAADVEKALLETETTRHGARNLLSFTSACGTFLGRIRDSRRALLADRKVRGVTVWKITALDRGAAEPKPAEGAG